MFVKNPSPPPPPPPPPLVLLVEDNEDLREATSRLLRLGGYFVQGCGTAMDAMRMAVTVKWDLLLIDVGLPDLDGGELLRRLRLLTPAPAIALTGFPAEHVEDMCGAAGFAHVLQKPFGIKALVEAIARFAPPGPAPAPALSAAP